MGDHLFLHDIKENDIYSDSIIILTSNHGEVLDGKYDDDKRFGHRAPWQEATEAVLMIHLPQKLDKEIEKQVELIDIYPTILDEAEIPVNKSLDKRLQGDSLKPLYRNEDRSRMNLLGSQERYDDLYSFTKGYANRNYAVLNSTWKMVSPIREKAQLYKIENSTNEKENLADKYPQTLQSLKSVHEKFRLKNHKLRSEIY